MECVLLGRNFDFFGVYCFLYLVVSAYNKNFPSYGQIIDAAPIQVVKLPSTVPFTAVTRVPFCFGLFALVKVYLH